MPERIYTKDRRRERTGSKRRVYTNREGSEPKKKGKSVLGFVGNLAEDVGETVIGLGPGLVKTGQALSHDTAALVGHVPGAGRYAKKAKDEGFQTDDIAKAIGKDYAHTYGPLLRGDVGKTLSRIYDHPLGPILDLTAVASGGVTAATKVGLVSKAGNVTLRSPGALAGQSAKILERPARKGDRALDNLFKKLPANTPLVGEAARFAKELEKLPRQDALRLKIKLRPYQKAWGKLDEHERIALGLIARGVSPREYRDFLRTQPDVEPKMLKLLERSDVDEAYRNPSRNLLDAADKARDVSDAAAEALIGRGALTREAADLRKTAAQREVLGDVPTDGRPEAFYLPDQSIAEKIPDPMRRASGGTGPAKSPVHKWEGTLLRMGRIALEPDVLTPAYLKTVRFSLYDDLHKALVESAVKIGPGERLPQGYRFIRRNHKERIPYTEKTAGAFERHLDELLPEDDSPLSFIAEGADDALEEGGFRYAVPQRTIDRVTGEFTRSGKALHWFIQKPTQVWRALVLNLRPAWLVNNIIGNHLLYAIRYAGPNGLRAYAKAVKETGNETAAFRQTMERHFPEQVEGTFIGSQRPGKRQKFQNRLSLGLAPFDRGVEGTLRRAATRAELRKMPEVRSRLKEMPRETRNFERAVDLAIEDNPLLARKVSDKVNAALGDFLDLSPFEQKTVRSILPFYAWYKAIVKITVRMPVDVPGRTLLLSKLGEIGFLPQDQEFPLTLQGLIPLGPPDADGRVRVLDTRSQNPYTTVIDLARMGEALAAGNPEDIGSYVSGINPFIQGPLEAIYGGGFRLNRQPVTGRGILLSTAKGITEGLPQVRTGQAFAGNAPTGNTLRDRDAYDELLRHFGVPYSRLSPTRARELR